MSDHAATLHEAARIVAAKGAVHMPELIELLKPHSPGPEVTAKLEAQLQHAAKKAALADELSALNQSALADLRAAKVPRLSKTPRADAAAQSQVDDGA